jgi:hypothetical protein
LIGCDVCVLIGFFRRASPRQLANASGKRFAMKKTNMEYVDYAENEVQVQFSFIDRGRLFDLIDRYRLFLR